MSREKTKIEELREQAGDKWNDWRWQFAHRISDFDTLAGLYAGLDRDTFEKTSKRFVFGVTPYYLALAKSPESPVGRQILPSADELEPFGQEDPLSEEEHTPVFGLVHRFHDRVLWYINYQCAAYCRFCTRKRKVGDPESRPGKEDREAALAYIRENDEIREVILSGGDPLTLPDEQLDAILADISAIGHINHIRIHTRIPVTMPMRITDALCSVLEKYSVYIVTHFNHPDEITADSERALQQLRRRAGAVLLNQSVLLAGVNDDAEILKELFCRLVRNGVRPYYLHQCDNAEGTSAFVVSPDRGLAIMEQLQAEMSGIAVPRYVIDVPGRHGKTDVRTGVKFA